MIRFLRRRLRTIAYYSARHERTVWTRAADVLLLLSPLLAIGLTLLLHGAVVRMTSGTSVSGYLSPDDAGGWTAFVEAIPSGRKGLSGPAEGDFEISMVTKSRGWPFASGRSIERPAMKVRSLRGLEGTSADAALRASIDRALRSEGELALADAVRTNEGTSRLRWTGLLGNFVAWWAVLFFLLPLIVLAARFFVWMLGEAGRLRRHRRARQGRCPSCGFDLRGSVWSSNCPECGGILE